MFKKLLFFGGLAGIGFSFYYYFKKQLDLALDLNYKLKELRVVELTTSHAKIKTQIEVVNKSSFNLNIDQYDIQFAFKGIPVARTQSDIPIQINSDQRFILDAEGDIDLRQVSTAILPFLSDVVKKKPIDLTLHGFVSVNFLNINYNVNLDGRTVNYSSNLLADVGFEKTYDKAVNKLDEILGKVGINI